jgi:hypothetical protein
MHAPHRLMHACTACIAPWHHRLMHTVTAWALLFWFCLGHTFISSYFVCPLLVLDLQGYLWWLIRQTRQAVLVINQSIF